MRDRRGVVLIDVLAALTIFSLAGVATLTMIAQLADSEARAQAAERRLADQDRLLTAYSLLAREDLDRRLGRRAVGPYVVEVQRPTADLYRVAVGDTGAFDLVTLLYRPEARGAAR